MYQPPKYKKDDKNYIFSFIQEYPFASVIMNGTRLMATHIPVLVEGDAENFRMFAHMANHNEMFKYLKNGSDALIIFHGPQSYVSSSWYKKKDISTWDYMAVHINAKVILQNHEELKDNLKRLVKRFEKDQENPLYYKDLPEELLETHLPQITGFWLEPEMIKGVAKLHQNFSKEDVKSVVRELENSGNLSSKELGREIRKENNVE